MSGGWWVRGQGDRLPFTVYRSPLPTTHHSPPITHSPPNSERRARAQRAPLHRERLPRTEAIDPDRERFLRLHQLPHRHRRAADLERGLIGNPPLARLVQAAQEQVPRLLARLGVDRVRARRELHLAE